MFCWCGLVGSFVVGFVGVCLPWLCRWIRLWFCWSSLFRCFVGGFVGGCVGDFVDGFVGGCVCGSVCVFVGGCVCGFDGGRVVFLLLAIFVGVLVRGCCR